MFSDCRGCRQRKRMRATTRELSVVARLWKWENVLPMVKHLGLEKRALSPVPCPDAPFLLQATAANLFLDLLDPEIERKLRIDDSLNGKLKLCMWTALLWDGRQSLVATEHDRRRHVREAASKTKLANSDIDCDWRTK